MIKKTLFNECLKNFLSSKSLLISGGTTFNYFYRYSLKDIIKKKIRNSCKIKKMINF